MNFKNRRLILYSVLLSPLLAAGCYFAMMPGDVRGSFLSDYGRTLGRFLTGQWEFEELTEPQRRATRRWRGNRESTSPGVVFQRLDKDDDDFLSAAELGSRLAAPFEDSNAQPDVLSVSLDEFRQVMQTRRFVSPRTDASSELANLEDHADAQRITVDSLFDPRRVAQIEIAMPPDDWRSLCSQSRSHSSAFSDPTAKPYSYFKGDIRIDGKLIKDVAIRKKGFLGSQDDVRPALKVKLAEYVEQNPIVGLDRLTLNNNKQDRALVSQYLTYELFRKAGIPAPRCAFAAVSVNGTYLGIYSNVEPVKEPFLRREFGNGEGNLYEGTLTDFYPKSIQWFEADTNKKNNDRSQILALAKLLDQSQPTVQEISQFVDIGHFLRFWAIESLINFWDGYTQNQNNFFVYQNPSDGLMYFMPWGADSCFSDRRPFRGGGDAQSVRATSILANRLFHNEEIPERYRSAMLDVLSEVWEEQHLLDELDRISSLLLDHMDFPQIQSVVAMDDVRDFIKGRRQQIMSELSDDTWPAEVPSHPRTPLYEDEVGRFSGTVKCERSQRDDAKELRTPLEVEVAAELTLDERTAKFRTAEVYGLDELAEGSSTPLSFEFVTTYEDEEVQLTLDTESLSELRPGEYRLTGKLEDWSNAQPGREIRGAMNLKSADIGSFELDVSFGLTLHEKRGGQFERRRW